MVRRWSEVRLMSVGDWGWGVESEDPTNDTLASFLGTVFVWTVIKIVLDSRNWRMYCCFVPVGCVLKKQFRLKPLYQPTSYLSPSHNSIAYIWYMLHFLYIRKILYVILFFTFNFYLPTQNIDVDTCIGMKKVTYQYPSH